MKTYYFCYLSDKSKEKIGSVQANSREEAIEMFSNLKNISAYEFCFIFDVIEQN